MLEGVRGAPPVNFGALEDILLRISQLVMDFPDISELDLNPVLATDREVVAVDGRVMLRV
jgi:acyl-CoA synthetase (NDP forming)